MALSAIRGFTGRNERMISVTYSYEYVYDDDLHLDLPFAGRRNCSIIWKQYLADIVNRLFQYRLGVDLTWFCEFLVRWTDCRFDIPNCLTGFRV